MRDKIHKIFMAAIIVAIVALIYRADFAIFRLKHPEAPAWTYIFK